ncbi:hypothetical protein [Chitinophaga silvisoli]|uniref:Uncharacterized protein n=1 Tax=Chitinophaga silvisoli TaxID=2291814 RepID=A0A3E1P0Y7_9BACT|nr:hypothetical protein [Chitinophaga silvisoli]RFM33805.1 hypothetical protein DXN04_17765 [Chitinophaga silvisoli]
MAKQTSILTFTGRLGPLTGFKRNGKHYFRNRPDGIRHTPNMKRAAQRFGQASRTGAFIRKALGIKGDGGHVNRFTKLLIPSAGVDLHPLTGLQFNKSKPTSSHFSKLPVLGKDGRLYIPAQAFPKGIRHVAIKLIAVRIDLQTRQVIGSNTAVINIDTSQKFEGAELCASVPGTGTLITALSVNDSAAIIAVKETQAVSIRPVEPHFIHVNVPAVPFIVLLE